MLNFKLLVTAARKCASGVSWKQSVQRYMSKCIFRLFTLINIIKDSRYKILKYVIFNVFEPKKRRIVSTRFRDRVLQKALCMLGVYKEITKSFVYDNCACLNNKGTTFALDEFKHHMRKVYLRNKGIGWYFLKIDVRKFFESISHEIAKKELSRRIKNKIFLKLVCMVIDSFEDVREPLEIKKDRFGHRNIGLGSQFSQLIALMVLDRIDHFIKEQLKVKFMIRYMDDYILIEPNKETALNHLRILIERFKELGFDITKKSQIIPFKNGINFLKVRFFYNKHGKLLRKPSKKKINNEKRKLKRMFLRYIEGTLPMQNIDDHFKGFYTTLRLKTNKHYFLQKLCKFYKKLKEQSIKERPLNVKSFKNINKNLIIQEIKSQSQQYYKSHYKW